MVNKSIATVKHWVSLAGRIVAADSQGVKPLKRALARIVVAPPAFVLPLVTRASLIRNTDPVIRHWQAALANSSASGDLQVQLRLAQLLLDYDWLNNGVQPAPLAARVFGLLEAETDPVTVAAPQPGRTLLDGLLAASATTPSSKPTGYAITNEAGYFYWLDLPAGAYTVIASLPGTRTRYGLGKPQTINVTEAAKGAQVQQFELIPTGVEGKVVETATPSTSPKVAVALAAVRVKGDEENTFTDMQGQFRLMVLEAGEKRLVLISKRASKSTGQNALDAATYVIKEIPVKLTQGETKNLGEIPL